MKKLSTLFLILLFVSACSVTTKISHNIIDKELNFKELKSGSWEIYAIKQMRIKSEGYAPGFNITKEKLLNQFLISTERKLKSVTCEVGYRELPEAITKDFSERNSEELLKFVKETSADYLIFLSDAGATHSTNKIQMHKDTPDLIASSTRYELIVNIWDVKKWKVVLSYGVRQEGSGDLKNITDLAIDYIIREGKIESD